MNKSILLIEDNEENRYLATFLLAGRGWHVTHAPDGPRGLELAAHMQPAVILLDIQLPGMDGYAVATALRRNASLDAVPIVAVTSYAMPGDRERCMQSGCDGYLEKPIDPLTFVQDVESFITTDKQQAAS